MKTMLILSIMFIAGCCNGVSTVQPPVKVTGDNISVVFVIDNSGSMGERISGSSSIKINAANSSLIDVGQSLDKYLKSGNDKTIGIGFVRFYRGGISTTQFVCISSNATEYITSVSRKFNDADGGTPLGNAIVVADNVLSSVSGTYKKHIVVLTDGVSNNGIEPVQALKQTKVPSSNIYFIALDLTSGAFSEVSKLSTVLEASNQVQLNQAFEKILVEKILLEKEE